MRPVPCGQLCRCGFSTRKVIVTGITPVPANAEITVSIVQRFDAKDAGVRAVTTGTPPEGYWLSSLHGTRNRNATGRPTALANYEGFIDTLPVDRK